MQEQIEVIGSLSTKDFSYPFWLTERTDIPWNFIWTAHLSHVFTQLPGTHHCSSSLPYLHSASLDKLVRKGWTQQFRMSKMSFSQRMQLPAQCKAGGAAEQSWSTQCPCPCSGSCAGMSPPLSEHRATHPQQKPVTNQVLHSSCLWRTVWNTENSTWSHICSNPCPGNWAALHLPGIILMDSPTLSNCALHCQTKAD